MVSIFPSKSLSEVLLFLRKVLPIYWKKLFAKFQVMIMNYVLVNIWKYFFLYTMKRAINWFFENYEKFRIHYGINLANYILVK